MSTYVLRYFPLKARAETCRALLSYNDSEYSDEAPVWPQDKVNQPVGQLPVLIETDESGNVFELSESLAIEHYLAAKHGLLVNGTPQDSARQDELRHQLVDIFNYAPRHRFTVEEARPSIKERFETQVQFFIKYHENHLKNNGSNGHYFGNEITYMDVALVATLRSINDFGNQCLSGMSDFFTPEKAPLINKVVEVVSADPKMAKYLSK
ncbi:hypothetical protein DL89DRAFT_119517 [Linderina pennispora]|uniref:Glutathione S-transferase n=1 Tax=Linderina pennispora TaxID=61395 RepID=A0A1Y1WCA4_9FUNG|nr:uncharacterized protein DL89DRAFT_119517 [Linderina pennispora]ORX71072.1 hypothetical protein DL89DRAFT_119517 [Linderina pennispora]